MKRTLKADWLAFYTTIVTYLKNNGVESDDLYRSRYTIKTKYGHLVVSHPEEWKRDNCGVHTLFARFNLFDLDGNGLPYNANQYSGKWNFHYFSKKGKGKEIAQYIIEKIEEIKIKE